MRHTMKKTLIQVISCLVLATTSIQGADAGVQASANKRYVAIDESTPLGRLMALNILEDRFQNDQLLAKDFAHARDFLCPNVIPITPHDVCNSSVVGTGRSREEAVQSFAVDIPDSDDLVFCLICTR